MTLERILLLACFFVISTSYSHPVKYLNKDKLTCPIQSASIPNFSVVDVVGNINVNLHTGYAKSTVQLSGDPEDLEDIKVRVSRKGILFIKKTTRATHRGPITADIRMGYLHGFAYVGKGTIRGEHLRSNIDRVIISNEGNTTLGGTIRIGYLDLQGAGFTHISGVNTPRLKVKLANKAQLKLTGVVGLYRLDAEDNTWFSAAWVKAPALIVRTSAKAYVQLAGVVNKLDAELWGASQFNARYLRARRAYVKTHDVSVAKVSTTHHQHLLATDASDIREYNLPEMKTDFMAFDGATLDMRAFNTAFVEEPTPYNK